MNLIDKLIFGIALLVSLQFPIFSDHYQQFLSGYFQSVSEQIQGYENTARQHEYVSIEAMIQDHLSNPTPSVRTDAEQKLRTLNVYYELSEATVIFENGNIFEKFIFMLNPSRFNAIKKTMTNFKPGIPLSPEGIAFGFILGLILNLFITLPLKLVFKTRK